MNRPPHDPADSAGVDESTDTYDTVEWLLKNVPDNNGRVGVLGVSYPGFLATMAGINPHPAVKAVSPQAPMTDTWMGDDFFHQGAFRLSYGFEYSRRLELSKDMSVPLPIGTWDTYDWYLRLGPLGDVDAKYFQGRNRRGRRSSPIRPTTRSGRRARCSAGSPRRRSPRSRWAAGGTRRTATARSRPTARSSAATPARRNSLVMGPWNHGGWRRGEPRRMAVVDPGTSEGYLRDVEAPWFAWWLKDKGKLTVPDAYLYDTGARQWRSFQSWPPKDGARRSLYLRAGGRVSFDPPAAGRNAVRPVRLRSRGSGALPPPARSSRRTTRAARTGAPGRPRTSVSWTAGPTWRAGCRRRSTRT